MSAIAMWLATALLPILAWPIIRAVYYGLSWLLKSAVALFVGKAALDSGITVFGAFFRKSLQLMFGSTTLSMFGLVFFFAGLKFIRYVIQLIMAILGYGAIYFLFLHEFVSQVYSLVIDKMLSFPPEFTQWLTYFGVFDGLRLLEATFLWIVAMKVVMWTLKPPSSLI